MTNAVVKIENREGKLVVTSRQIAEQLGKRHADVLKQLEVILANENLRSLVIPSLYKDKQDKDRKEYLLTKDGFTLYMFNIQGFNEFKLAYINEFNRMEQQLQSIGEKERLLLGLFSQDAMTVAESHKKLVELETKPLIEKLEYKQEVINGMTDDIKLQTQRQYLNKIVRMGQRQGESIQARWSMLYNFYETHKHINLSARVEGYKRANGVKNITKLEYIDRQGDIPLLYSIAVKLFESDFKKSLKNYLEIL